MTMQDAIKSCHSDDLYGSSDTRMPMLLAKELLDNIRLWVIIHEMEEERCMIFYLAEGRSLDDVLYMYEHADRSGTSLKWLHESCTGSNNWQVLSIEELAAINQRSFDEIPHREAIDVSGGSCCAGQPV